MNIVKVFSRSGLLVLAVLFMIPCASAWVFSGWVGPDGQAPLKPGDAVNAGFTMSFSSFESGTTFDSDDSLSMFTGLSNPEWVVTKTDTVNDEPVTTQLAKRKSATVRLDSWDLTFSRKQFTVDVILTGTVPLLNQSEEITILRLQETDPDAQIVPGTQIKKTVQVAVPTPEPTAVPTMVQVEETVIVVTPESPAPVTTSVPQKKVTYSPGPDPVLVCGMLAGLIMVAGLVKRRT